MATAAAPRAAAGPAAVTRRPDRLAIALVWGAWALLLVAVLVHIARYARNVPLAEDWTMVPALTGHEDHFWSWVWSQNNEHRIPIARLTYLGLLAVTHDFRSAMYVDAVALAGLAAAAVLVARRLRGGVTSYLDVIFPLLLLHLGHWENLVWGWEITFVISAGVMLGLVLLLAGARMPLRPRAALGVAALLAALPLTGASGIPYAVVMAVTAVAMGRRFAGRSRLILTGGAGLSLLVTGLYFVGYQSPYWEPQNPGVGPTLRTTAQFAGMSLGPGVHVARHHAVVLVAALVIAVAGSAFALLVRRIVRGPADAERQRAIGLAGILLAAAALALSIGYGRSAPGQGMQDRYALLAVPALVAAWFAWERYGPRRPRRLVQAVVVAAALVALPYNVQAGYRWRDWYVAGMTSVQHDLAAGAGPSQLVARHLDFLVHWSPWLLTHGSQWLRQERIGPFARMAR